MKAKIIAIVAMDEGRVIGNANELPWHYSEDQKHFKKLTTGHTVFMGRKTYESLPERFRPLPKRQNVVVSRNPEALSVPEGVKVVSNPVEFIKGCQSGEQQIVGECVWVIGGAQIYQLTLPYWDEVHLTRVPGKHEGDAFFPEFENDFRLLESQQLDELRFEHYIRNAVA